MAKKSYNKGGTKSRHSLRAAPRSSNTPSRHARSTERRVKDAAMDADRVTTRAIMERQLGSLSVEAPADSVEATLIKASKMLEPTRLYGLVGYNILLIIPVGTRSADAHDENRATNHAEVIALAR
eukprot:scaffold88207_cov35-Attheya_sp.AAC.1